MGEVIKCKFCKWQHKKYYRNKKGKLVDGQKKLLDHVEVAHWDEFLEIQERLGDIEDKGGGE